MKDEKWPHFHKGKCRALGKYSHPMEHVWVSLHRFFNGCFLFFARRFLYVSKKFPTYPRNKPQTLNQQPIKQFFSFGGLGMPGVAGVSSTRWAPGPLPVINGVMGPL